MKNKAVKQQEKIIDYKSMAIDILSDEIRFQKSEIKFLQILSAVLILLIAITNAYHIWNFDNFATKAIKPMNIKLVKRVE